jgi:hypothetical protein
MEGESLGEAWSWELGARAGCGVLGGELVAGSRQLMGDG